MKTNLNIIFKFIRKHMTKFITTATIIAISVGVMFGVGKIESEIKTALSNYYTSQDVSDINIRTANKTGFSKEKISWIKETFGEKNILKTFYYETKVDNEINLVYTLDLSNSFNNLNLNKFELIEGKYPTEDFDILVEHKTNGTKQYLVGDKVTFFGNEYTVCGIIVNPLYISNFTEQSFQYPNEKINYIFYVNSKAPPMINDVFIKLDNRNLFKGTFTNNYSTLIENTKNEIISHFNDDNITIFSLYNNQGIYSLYEKSEQFGNIAIILNLIILLLSLFIVYYIISKVLKIEIEEILHKQSLGFSKLKIISLYIIFMLIATTIGSIIAYPIGYGLTYLIYSSFNTQYAMPTFPNNIGLLIYVLIVLIILFIIILLTLIKSIFIIKQNKNNYSKTQKTANFINKQ